jgi:hypothetical protein
MQMPRPSICAVEISPASRGIESLHRQLHILFKPDQDAKDRIALGLEGPILRSKHLCVRVCRGVGLFSGTRGGCITL